MDEKELVRRVALQDHRAFQVLYERHSRKVYAHCLRLLHIPELAEEAVQEIFVKVWLLGERLLEVENLDGYLKISCRNHCLNAIRRLVTEERAGGVLTAGYSDSENSTEETVLLNDARRQLQTAVEKLPEQQRLAYRLCHEQGLTYEDAAGQLGISVNTLKTHLKRAIHALRKQLENRDGMMLLFIFLKLF